MRIWINFLLVFYQFIMCFGAKQTTQKKQTTYNPSKFQVTYDPIKEVILPSDEHKVTVFFLHGQGRSGFSQRNYIMNITRDGQTVVLPNFKFIFPSAPKRRFTLHNRQMERIWYDIDYIGRNQTEDSTTMEQSLQGLLKLIREEINQTGISWNRIAIGGYGMGGKLALHMGYRVLVKIGAIFSICGFLPQNSTVFAAIEKTLSSGGKLPKLFYGETELLENKEDEDHEWHKKTYHELEAMGAKGRHSIANQGGGNSSDSVIDDLLNWLNCTLLSDSE